MPDNNDFDDNDSVFSVGCIEISLLVLSNNNFLPSIKESCCCFLPRISSFRDSGLSKRVLKGTIQFLSPTISLFSTLLTFVLIGTRSCNIFVTPPSNISLSIDEISNGAEPFFLSNKGRFSLKESICCALGFNCSLNDSGLSNNVLNGLIKFLSPIIPVSSILPISVLIGLPISVLIGKSDFLIMAFCCSIFLSTNFPP